MQFKHCEMANNKSTHLEATLIEALRQGDEQALKTFYQTNYALIANLITNNGGSEVEAQDIYQESIIILYEKLQDPSFELSCQLKTYLYSVARRQWLKMLASKQRYVGKISDYEEVVEISPEEADAQQKQERQLSNLESAMQELGEPCRSILQAFYLDKKSMEKIMEEMQYANVNTAKNQKYKCLQRLKKIFFKAS